MYVCVCVSVWVWVCVRVCMMECYKRVYKVQCVRLVD